MRLYVTAYHDSQTYLPLHLDGSGNTPGSCSSFHHQDCIDYKCMLSQEILQTRQPSIKNTRYMLEVEQ